jgi:glucose/arabinose dehydrogenase
MLRTPHHTKEKILRFNLDVDGDAGAGCIGYLMIIPYSATSAVWSIGIRNNQGFAYDPL